MRKTREMKRTWLGRSTSSARPTSLLPHCAISFGEKKNDSHRCAPRSHGAYVLFDPELPEHRKDDKKSCKLLNCA